MFDNEPVRVETCADPMHDAIAVRIESPLVAQGRLGVVLAFPYGSPSSTGADWNRPDAHATRLTLGRPAGRLRAATRQRSLRCAVEPGRADGGAALTEENKHTFVLAPDKARLPWNAFATFAKERITGAAARLLRRQSGKHRATGRGSGPAAARSIFPQAAIRAGRNLSGGSCFRNICWPSRRPVRCRPRRAGCSTTAGTASSIWKCTGGTGRITRCGTAGRCLSAAWVGTRESFPPPARRRRPQGYRGARWPKMVGPEGRDSPSGVGPLLIWQQPHPIFYAQLDYRLHPTVETLKKWQRDRLRDRRFHGFVRRARQAIGPLCPGAAAEDRAGKNRSHHGPEPDVRAELLAIRPRAAQAVAGAAGAAARAEVGGSLAWPGASARRRRPLFATGGHDGHLHEMELGASVADRRLGHVAGRWRGSGNHAGDRAEGDGRLAVGPLLGLGLSR